MTGRDDALDADYAAAGFSGRLGFGTRPALLNVDWAKAYLEPGASLYAGVEAARDSAARVLAAARAADIPIAHTRVEYEPGGADGGVFYRKVSALSSFDRGNPLGEFVDEMAPADGEVVVTKQYASGFFGTSLAATLTSWGVDSVIITGLSTSGCVRATALDACQHGFVPIVIADAVGDRDPDVQRANLFDLDAKYADVVSEADALGHLAQIGSKGTA